jgi:hypothetical protein
MNEIASKRSPLYASLQRSTTITTSSGLEHRRTFSITSMTTLTIGPMMSG